MTLNLAEHQSYPGDITGNVNIVNVRTNAQSATRAKLSDTESTLVEEAS